MEETARIIMKAFTNCVTDRYVPHSPVLELFNICLEDNRHMRNLVNGACTMLSLRYLSATSGYGYPLIAVRSVLIAFNLAGQADIISQEYPTCYRRQSRHPSIICLSEITPGYSFFIAISLS